MALISRRDIQLLFRRYLGQHFGVRNVVEDALGKPDPGCVACEGEGWVCENHHDKAWPVVCDCGAGDPCPCRPGI